jgi:hypothetical protein
MKGMEMRMFALGLLLWMGASQAIAGDFSCAENDVTHAYMCFVKTKVRVNGDVRATSFYQGGPKGVDDTGFTARVNCTSGVLELTDRKGVAFIRNVPKEQVGLDFVRYLCEHKTLKKDPSLSTK